MRKKAVCLFLAGVTALSLMMGVSVQAENTNQMENYATVIETDDSWASVTKIIVGFGENVTTGIAPEQFKVSVRKTYAGTDDLVQELSYETFEYSVSPTAEGERKVENAYFSDEKGNEVEGESKYVTLVMESSPTEGYGSPYGTELESGYSLNVMLDCKYTIEYTDESGNSQTCAEVNEENCQIPAADRFTNDQKYETTTQETLDDGMDNDVLYYASYEPEDEEKHPLVVWLHGMGEGGAKPDTRIPLVATEAGVFAEDEFQNTMGGAYVLVPQCPTMWMNVTGATYDTTAENPTSMYTKTLMELIENYVAEHENIDTNRILIGGCSNGGYMTMNMIINYPDYFAAAFPVCEAYNDSFITDEQIESLKGIPIWFTHAASDPLVVPNEYTVPTYKRLIEAGAENVHFTYWTDVHDISGRFLDEEGNPEVYYGHGSWVYAFNNLCTLDNDYVEGKTTDNPGNGETIFQWLSEQTKQ